MSLGTNYKRNVDSLDKLVTRAISDAVHLSRLFERDLEMDVSTALDLGAQVVMGRITEEEIYEKYPRKVK